MTESNYDRTDHELLIELVAVTEELRAIAKPTSIYRKVKFWAALAAGMTFNLGLMLVLGGHARISSTSYSVIHDSGGSIVWGSIFMVVALFTALCIWRVPCLLQWALIMQALPYGAIAVSFGLAALKYPDANITATPIYTWIMIIHAFLSDDARKEY